MFKRNGGIIITHKEFDAVFEEQVGRCAALLQRKSGEYAKSGADRLASFRTAAALQGCSPEKALAGMLAKHIVSIYDMCRADSTHYDAEVWDEKITDSINYLILLKAIVKEEQSHKQNRSKNTELCGGSGG